MMHTAQILMKKDATKSWYKVGKMKLWSRWNVIHTHMTCSKGYKHSAIVLVSRYIVLKLTCLPWTEIYESFFCLIKSIKTVRKYWKSWGVGVGSCIKIQTVFSGQYQVNVSQDYSLMGWCSWWIRANTWSPAVSCDHNTVRREPNKNIQ